MNNNEKILLEGELFKVTILRLCHQLIENHNDFSESVIVGIQPRGTWLAERVAGYLYEISGKKINIGKLDVTFYRDDFRRKPKLLIPSAVKMDVLIEGKKVILVDDVFYTGRTVRAALDALVDFGRPQNVELLVLINRRFCRNLPIQPTYIGKSVDTITSERVRVNWKESDNNDKVVLHKQQT